MKWNIDECVNYLDSMTNEKLERYTVIENSKELTVSDLSKVGADVPSCIKLYTPNLKTGKASVYTLNVHIAHVDSGMFAKQVASAFYKMVDADITEVSTACGDISMGDLDEDHSIRMTRLKTRIANAHAICENGGKDGKYSDMAYTFAKVAYGAKKWDDKIENAMKPIMTELERLWDTKPKAGDAQPSVKPLRELLTTFGRAVWTTDVDNGVHEYTFNCNATLAKEVYARFYKGRSVDRKTGNVSKSYNKSNVIIIETLLAMLEDLQNKRKTWEEEQAKSAQPIEAEPAK